MIDFVKFTYKEDSVEHLLESPHLTFKQSYTPETSVLGRRLIASFQDLKFTIYEPTKFGSKFRVTIQGSLHKYWNKGLHNYNDFGTKELHLVFRDLHEKFHVNPKQCSITQLEVGINICPPIPTKLLLKKCKHHIHGHELKKVCVPRNGNYLQASFQHYFIKYYDKRAQYSKKYVLNKEIFRFEIKYRKSHILKKLGFRTMADILTIGLEMFAPILLEKWKLTIISEKEFVPRKWADKYDNPDFWSSLNAGRFKYHRKNLTELTNKTDSIKEQIARKINEKCKSLTRKSFRITSSSIVANQEELKKLDTTRKCPITGLDISMQKEDSYLLSHTGLKYYSEKDRKTYEHVKNRYLTDKWLSESFQKQIEEIAHNIRNTMSNRRIKQKRLYHPTQLHLFAITPP